MVRFGESERIYLLEGPDELRAPEEEVRRRAKGPPLPTAALAADAVQGERGKGGEEREERKEGEEEGREEYATWGMAEDAAAEDEEEDVGSSSSSLYHRLFLYLTDASPSLSAADSEALSDSQRAMVQRIERKKQKMLNLQTEVDTLLGKERKAGSLTDGQQSQKEKNEQRIEAMQAEMMEDIEALREALQRTGHHQPAGASAARGRGSDDEGGDDSDDEFFDRTATHRGKAKVAASSAREAGGSSPLASLLPVPSLTTSSAVTAQLRRCEELRDSLRVVLRDLTSAEDATSAADSLDAFMGQVEAQRRAERRDKVKGELRALQMHHQQLTGRLREMEAEERVHCFRQQQEAAATEAKSHSAEEEEKKEEERDSARKPALKVSADALSPQDGAGAGGSVADALARVRSSQAPSSSAVKAAVAAKLTTAIGPAPRPPTPSPSPSLPPASPASIPSPTPSAAPPPSSASSSIADLARRLDAARASSTRDRGDASLTAVLKRRMESTAEVASDVESKDRDSGGLLVRKRSRVDHRDHDEAQIEVPVDEAAYESSWMPPVNQRGDGRTERNDRLGY